MIDGQMSLFDLLPTADPDINTIPEEEAVRLVGDALGLVFKYNDRFELWEAKKGKLKMTLEYDNYCVEYLNYARFLGAGYSFGTDGGGAPLGGISQAVNYFRAKIKKYDGKKPERLEVDE